MSRLLHSLSAAIPVIAVALQLTACGGDSASSGQSHAAPDEAVASTDVPVGAFYTGRSEVMPQAKDSDGDGLLDDIDPLPQRAPEALPAAAPFDLAAFGVPFEQGRLTQGYVHADQPFQLHVPGLAALSDSAWLIVRSAEQDQVIALPAQDTIQIDPRQLLGHPHSLAIMTRNWITPWRALRFLPQGAPLVQALGQAHIGEPLRLKGLNLDQAVYSHGHNTLEGQGDAQAFTLAWPASGAYSELQVSAHTGPVQQLELHWLRRVAIALDATLTEALGALSFYDGSAFVEIDASRQIEREVMAFAPSMLGFSHLGDAGLPSVVRVVVWPDQDQVEVNLDAWLQAMALGHPIVRKALRDMSWTAQRALLEQALDGDILSHGRSVLEQALQGQDDGYISLSDTLAREVLAHMSQPAPSKLLLGTELVLSDDDVNRRILRYQQGRERNGEADKIFAGSFAHFDVGTVAHLCGDRTAGRPSGVSSGDLCVVNRNQVPASVAVRHGSSDSNSLWSDHVSVRAGIFNPDILGGTGGFFNLELFGDAGYFGFKQTHFFPKAGDSTLCNSSECQVEIVTAGYGYGLDETLDARERSVSEMLRTRSIIDVMILPVISLATGEDFNYSGPLAKCLATASITALDFVTKSTDIYQKINDSKGDDGELDVSKLATNLLPIVANDLKGILSDARLPGCFAAAAVQGAEEAAEEAAERGLKQVLNRLKASPIGLLMEGFSMAEGWIEIAATPSLLIFETELMLKPERVQPAMFDATADLSGEIQVIGRCLGRKVASDNDDCSHANGEDDPAYHPISMRFSGPPRSGGGIKRVEVPLSAASVASVKDGNGNIEDFPFVSAITADIESVVQQIGLALPQDQLKPGLLDVDLIYLDADGARIHIPAGKIEYRAAPTPDPLDNHSWVVGQLGFISGYRLDRFDVSSSRLLLSSVELGGSQDHEINELRLSPAGNETDIEFDVPQSLLPQARSMLKFEAWLQTPQHTFELGSVIVHRGAVSRSRLSDYGSCKDDTASLALLNASGQVVQDAAGNKAEIRISPDNWSQELKWDNALLDANSVAAVRITCEEPGNDMCGNSLQYSEGGGASVCTLGYEIDSSQPFFSRKQNISLGKNESKIINP